MRVRELRASDRAALERIVRGTGAFSEDEVEVALELVDAGLGPQDEDPYRFLVAEDERGEPVGYACYGHVPMTEGVYDLYWIVVDAAQQGRGVGKALLRATEADVARLGGRIVIIETAGKPEYAAQRAFYERAGCTEVARIRDFYRVGDDKVVYARYLA